MRGLHGRVVEPDDQVAEHVVDAVDDVRASSASRRVVALAVAGDCARTRGTWRDRAGSRRRDRSPGRSSRAGARADVRARRDREHRGRLREAAPRHRARSRPTARSRPRSALARCARASASAATSTSTAPPESSWKTSSVECRRSARAIESRIEARVRRIDEPFDLHDVDPGQRLRDVGRGRRPRHDDDCGRAATATASSVRDRRTVPTRAGRRRSRAGINTPVACRGWSWRSSAPRRAS